jgi:hypothetical protein
LSCSRSAALSANSSTSSGFFFRTLRGTDDEAAGHCSFWLNECSRRLTARAQQLSSMCNGQKDATMFVEHCVPHAYQTVNVCNLSCRNHSCDAAVPAEALLPCRLMQSRCCCYYFHSKRHCRDYSAAAFVPTLLLGRHCSSLLLL